MMNYEFKILTNGKRFIIKKKAKIFGFFEVWATYSFINFGYGRRFCLIDRDVIYFQSIEFALNSLLDYCMKEQKKNKKKKKIEEDEIMSKGKYSSVVFEHDGSLEKAIEELRKLGAKTFDEISKESEEEKPHDPPQEK